MAKGVEDTALYRYVRLLALNEVGGDPGRFSLGVDEFHAANMRRADRFPHALLAGTTHDTKRSADVRARIGALAGIALQLARARSALARPDQAGSETGRRPTGRRSCSSTRPSSARGRSAADRLASYLRKALREAKRNTNWVEPNEEWEDAVIRFADRLCSRATSSWRASDPSLPRSPQQAHAPRSAQLVLRFTSPGVPDIYDGEELPLFTLVDPDNRRPVDWERRRRLLDELGAMPALPASKLWVIRELLALRARQPLAFVGTYEPLAAGRALRVPPREQRARRSLPSRRPPMHRAAEQPLAQRPQRDSELTGCGVRASLTRDSHDDPLAFDFGD